MTVHLAAECAGEQANVSMLPGFSLFRRSRCACLKRASALVGECWSSRQPAWTRIPLWRAARLRACCCFGSGSCVPYFARPIPPFEASSCWMANTYSYYETKGGAYVCKLLDQNKPLCQFGVTSSFFRSLPSLKIQPVYELTMLRLRSS